MKNMTDITFVLDRSGSMQCIADDTIGGFNKFLEEQKKEPSPATFTLVQFDDQYEVVRNALPIRDVAPLDRNTFVPRGWTALLDAIGRTINETGKRLAGIPEDERPDKVVFVILTDGMENQSKEFKKAQIAEMIEKQRSQFNWQFLFLGANQDAIQEAGGLGIPGTHAMTYAQNAVGTQSSFKATSAKLSAFRGGARGQSIGYNDDDRKQQQDAGLTGGQNV